MALHKNVEDCLTFFYIDVYLSSTFSGINKTKNNNKKILSYSETKLLLRLKLYEHKSLGWKP